AVEQMMPAGEPEIAHRRGSAAARPNPHLLSIARLIPYDHALRSRLIHAVIYNTPAPISCRRGRPGGAIMPIRIVKTARAALAAMVLAFAAAASAQTYPAKPIRVIVPFAAGGITDILARALGQGLGEALGQPIVVENRPGANSLVGTEFVARAAPDGYTLLVSADTTFVMNPHLYGKVAHDAAADLVPV